MQHLIAAAIMWLAPSLGSTTVGSYARLIAFEAKWYKADPLVVVALIHTESGWRKNKRSPTNDHGLMQVHVARRGSSRFYGREAELLDPATNIREGTRLLDMWKRYHERACKADAHPYWAHMKYGYRVKDPTRASRVGRIVEMLRRRFVPGDGAARKANEPQAALNSRHGALQRASSRRPHTAPSSSPRAEVHRGQPCEPASPLDAPASTPSCLQGPARGAECKSVDTAPSPCPCSCAATACYPRRACGCNSRWPRIPRMASRAEVAACAACECNTLCLRSPGMVSLEPSSSLRPSVASISDPRRRDKPPRVARAE